MRWIHIPILIGLFACAGWAQEDLRRAQVAAATANAMASLEDQVGREVIADNLPVTEFFRKTDSMDLLKQAIRRAEMIGGPRWPDERTCQVRMELSGGKVAAALQQAAASHPDRMPIAPAELNRRLQNWDQRVFSATGVSAAPASIESISPQRGAGPWASIPRQISQQAAAAARADAVRRLLESVGPVELSPGRTLNDALQSSELRQSIQTWLESRPVRRVEFRDNLQVQVTLAILSGEYYETLRRVIQSHKEWPQPDNEQQWQALRNRIAVRMADPIGQASVSPAAEQPVAAVLPVQPPSWVFQQMDAAASAPQGESKLKSARAAEQLAIQKLAEQIRALPLSPNQTLGQAADRNPSINEGLRRALLQARTFKVDYNRPDGTVLVKVYLDLRGVWEQIHVQP
jgi:hypothetical protein